MFWKSINRLIWSCLFFVIAVTIYSNYHFPHGPEIGTGDFICNSSNQCGEQSLEDTQRLDIPEWAKFARTSTSELLVGGLFLIGVWSSYQKDVSREG